MNTLAIFVFVISPDAAFIHVRTHPSVSFLLVVLFLALYHLLHLFRRARLKRTIEKTNMVRLTEPAGGMEHYSTTPPEKHHDLSRYIIATCQGITHYECTAQRHAKTTTQTTQERTLQTPERSRSRPSRRSYEFCRSEIVGGTCILQVQSRKTSWIMRSIRSLPATRSRQCRSLYHTNQDSVFPDIPRVSSGKDLSCSTCGM